MKEKKKREQFFTHKFDGCVHVTTCFIQAFRKPFLVSFSARIQENFMLNSSANQHHTSDLSIGNTFSSTFNASVFIAFKWKQCRNTILFIVFSTVMVLTEYDGKFQQQ